MRDAMPSGPDVAVHSVCSRPTCNLGQFLPAWKLITGGSICIDFPCINADGVASGSSSVPGGGTTAKLPTDDHSADAAAADEKLTMKKAIIVGGSMAGMLAGNMLIRQGWDGRDSRADQGGSGGARRRHRAPAFPAGRARTRRRDRCVRTSASASPSAWPTIAPASPLRRIPTTNTARRGPCSTTSSAMRSPAEHFHAGRNVYRGRAAQ